MTPVELTVVTSVTRVMAGTLSLQRSHNAPSSRRGTNVTDLNAIDTPGSSLGHVVSSATVKTVVTQTEIETSSAGATCTAPTRHGTLRTTLESPGVVPIVGVCGWRWAEREETDATGNTTDSQTATGMSTRRAAARAASTWFSCS